MSGKKQKNKKPLQPPIDDKQVVKDRSAHGPATIPPLAKHPVLLGISVMMLVAWFGFMLWVATHN